MIIKERDPQEHDDNNPFLIAGAKAEEQMAFYLRRSFYDDKNIHVFNDLRFHDDTGDSAQIDHLILYKYGFIIVESKSVTTGIKVNRNGEWIRFWQKRPQGMPSPILQAIRQIDFLKRAIESNAEELTGKILGLVQKGFGGYEWDVLVAISDRGTITRETTVPELCKADQVPDRIRERFNELKKKSLRISLKDEPTVWMDKKTIEQVTQFLLDHHDPRLKPKFSVPPENFQSEPVSIPVDMEAPQTKLCPKCGGGLVARTAKKGKNAGSVFWGCSSYPKCHYVEPISD